jgi:DNA-binding transcriptional ArsR family regulator
MPFKLYNRICIYCFGDATAFQALAEPHRREILDLLSVEPRSVGELVAALPVSQPAVSKHLRVLREAGLVESRAEAQRRIYSVRSEPLHELDRWLEPYRRMWSRRLDALGRRLEQIDETPNEEQTP